MPNSMKLLIRTLLILALMFGGSWLSSILKASAEGGDIVSLLSSVIIYLVCFLIGLVAGSMVGPRFTKQKNKFLYLFPAVLFLLIGIAPLAYPVFSMLPFPGVIAGLSQYTLLSFTFTGLFSSLCFR